MQRYLKIGADLALIFAAVSAVAFLVTKALHREAPADASAPYKLGETFPSPLPMITSMQPTVLLSLNSRCIYCDASIPFYRRLSALAEGRARLVVVGTQPLAELESYVRANALRVDGVTSVGADYLRTTMTPFVLVLNTQGKIVEALEGQLTEAGERSVIRAARLVQEPWWRAILDLVGHLIALASSNTYSSSPESLSPNQD